jgi:ATP-dependent helicase YprA (DUF1998 family)
MSPPTVHSEATNSNQSLPQVCEFTEDKLDEIDFQELGQKTFGKVLFDWQIEAAKAILRGDDVILDVGTGNGKSLTFTLPLLASTQDTVLIISPLTALPHLS